MIYLAVKGLTIDFRHSRSTAVALVCSYSFNVMNILFARCLFSIIIAKISLVLSTSILEK